MGNPKATVSIPVKTTTTAPGKAAPKAGAAAPEKPAKEKKTRTKKEKPAIAITVDENNIPNIADAEGALIVGIGPKQFFAYLTDAQKKDKNIRHAAKTRMMEYAVHMANYRLTEHTEKKNPKKKLKDQYTKMMAKIKAMKAELGDDVADVEDVEA